KMGGLWPLTSGGRQRSFHILSELARAHELVVVTTAQDPAETLGLQEALGRGARVENVAYAAPKHESLSFVAALARSWLSPYPVDLWKWRSARVRSRIDALIAAGPFDAIVADFLVTVSNVPLVTVPVVYFAHNVEYAIWRRLQQCENRPLRRRLLGIE